MLASTEKSLEIDRQRRSQLQRVDPFRCSRSSGYRAEASSGFCRPQSSEQFVGGRTAKTTSTALTGDVGQAEVAGLNGVQQPTRYESASSGSVDDQRIANRKLKNADKPTKHVRVRRHDSVINDSAVSTDASSATDCVPDVVAEVRAAPLNCDAPKRQARRAGPSSGHDVMQTTVGGHSRFVSRRWSSLRDLSSSQSPTAGGDRRSSSGRRGMVGGRTSRLDRHVYQCYFAGILHSSRRSERFLRLQQLYAALEDTVEIEAEMLSLRQRTTSEEPTDELPGSTDAMDPSVRKHWHERSLELRKLYAKLDAAQNDKEFFYDNGRLNAFQWKSWMDLGLSKRNSSLAKLKDLFEEAVVNSRSAIATKTSQLQRVERGLSYGKLLGTFRRLETRSRKEAEAWLRWQSSSQHSVASDRKLDGTYIRLMESSARNAKVLALHGYHMHEHRNRYDAYVQSRRIYRPKSAPNIFEPPSNDEQMETEEAASSDQTTLTASFCDNSFHCSERSEGPTAKPESNLTDSSQILSPVTSVGSVTKCSSSGECVDTCAEASCASSEKEIVSVDVVAAVKQSLPERLSFDENLTQQQVRGDDDPDAVVTELDKLGSRSKQKSRRRERQRPRSRNGHATTEKRADNLAAAVPGSAARRHIEAWRRSLRPLSGTLNQALAYFNSLCIDDSNDTTNTQSTRGDGTSDSALSQNKTRETRGQTVSTEMSGQFMPAFSSSTENEEVPVGQLAGQEEKFSIVNSGESVAVPDCGKVRMPQLHSRRDEVNAAEFPTSSLSNRSLATTCPRAVNIDKRRSQSKVGTMERSSQSRGRYAKKNDIQPTASQNDVTTRPEVYPTYVRSAPIVHMRSESQPIQTTCVASPVFVDCRQAGVRKLPTLIGKPSADHLNPKYSDQIMSSASNSEARMDKRISKNLLYSDWSTPYEEAKQTNRGRCAKDEDGKVAVTSAVSATQRTSLPEDTRRAENNAMYVTAIDSSSFICRRCRRSLAACRCTSTAETGATCRDEHRPDVVDHADVCRPCDDGRKSASVTSADSCTATGSRSVGERHQPPVTTGTFPLSQRRPSRPEQGHQDAEMRRMMASLETIDSEWTNCKPTRWWSQQPVHLTSDMNNNDDNDDSSNIINISSNNNKNASRQWKSGSSNIDQRQLASSGYLDQREISKLAVMHAYLQGTCLH